MAPGTHGPWHPRSLAPRVPSTDPGTHRCRHPKCRSLGTCPLGTCVAASFVHTHTNARDPGHMCVPGVHVAGGMVFMSMSPGTHMSLGTYVPWAHTHPHKPSHTHVPGHTRAPRHTHVPIPRHTGTHNPGHTHAHVATCTGVLGHTHVPGCTHDPQAHTCPCPQHTCPWAHIMSPEHTCSQAHACPLGTHVSMSPGTSTSPAHTSHRHTHVPRHTHAHVLRHTCPPGTRMSP